MLNYLIEIIFPEVDINNIASLLKDLTLSGNGIRNYNATIETKTIQWDVENSIEEIFSKNKHFGLFVNLQELKRDRIKIPNCGIAVYREEGIINLEINFQLFDVKELEPQELTKGLMEFAKNLACQYKINDYFCGIEPAEDAETRLFTNDQLGPLFLR